MKTYTKSRRFKPLHESLKYRVAENGCHEFTGNCGPKGYGRIYRMAGGRKLMWQAHRIAYEHHKGPIPEDQCVRHTCDNPCCINPDHLLAGTWADNARDREERGRGNPLRGERHHQAKLTWEQVREIRAIEGRTQRDIAAEYGVTQKVVQRIRSGIGWRED